MWLAPQSTPPPLLNQQEAPPTVDRTVELLATPPADNTSSVPESTMIHRYPSSTRKPPDIELSSTYYI